MTTPGGVPNLPPGALTLDNLASDLQDMTTPAMRSRATGRISSIFNNSTGGNPAIDVTPLGIITLLFAGFNSTVANADPADIQGPDDLPGLLTDFILDLPEIVVEAPKQILDMLGNYLGIPNLGAVLQNLALLPDTLMSGMTGENQTGGTTTLEDLFTTLRNIFGQSQQQDPNDTTPPTAPNLTLDSVTHSTLTITASGGTDL